MGAALAFRQGDLYQLKLNVHDESASRKSALYFNQVYAMIREALREGVQRIDFGGEANKAKLLRGCRGFPAFSVLLPRRDCPVGGHRAFLAGQNRRHLERVRGEVAEWGQYENQAEEDLGPAIAFAQGVPGGTGDAGGIG
jgi:hypothetical protein